MPTSDHMTTAPAMLHQRTQTVTGQEQPDDDGEHQEDLEQGRWDAQRQGDGEARSEAQETPAAAVGGHDARARDRYCSADMSKPQAAAAMASGISTGTVSPNRRRVPSRSGDALVHSSTRIGVS